MIDQNLRAIEAEEVTTGVAPTKRGSADGFYVGGDGDVEVVTGNGTTVLFSGLIAGQIVPINIRLIDSGNTTATNLVYLFSYLNN